MEANVGFREMKKLNSMWQSKEVATAYLDGVRGAIPGADFQLAVLGKIVRMWNTTPRYILDLGCGDGILGRYLLDNLPKTKVVFIDFSDTMLDQARRKLSGNPRAQVIKSDFSSSAWLKSVAKFKKFDAIVSGFAIHHQPDGRKKALYNEIYDLLSPGGIFLNLEHVSSMSPAGSEMFDEFFIDQLFSYHRRKDSNKKREEVARAYYDRPDKKENILAPVDRQCQWLREIGFRDVDCFFKIFELALFGGRKLSNKALQRTRGQTTRRRAFR